MVFTTLPPVVLLLDMFGGGVHSKFHRSHGGITRLGSRVRSDLLNMEIMGSFANRRVRGRGFGGNGRNCLDVGSGICRCVTTFRYAADLLSNVLCVLTIITNTLFVVCSNLGPTSLVIFLVCVAALLGSVEGVMRFTRRFRHNVANVRHFSRVVTASPSVGSHRGTIRLGSIGNSVRFGSIAFGCISRASSVLSRLSLRVPTNGGVTLINRSNNNGAAVYSLVPHFCRVLSNSLAVSNISVHSVGLGSLHSRVNIIRRSICLFSNDIHRGVRCKGPKTDSRRVVGTTGVTNTSRFVDALPSNCSACINRHNIGLSNKRGRHVDVTHIFLGGPPVLLLSRTADTLSGRDRHLIRGSLRHLSGNHAALAVTRHLAAVGGTGGVVIFKGGNVVRANARSRLLTGGKACTRLCGASFGWLGQQRGLTTLVFFLAIRCVFGCAVIRRSFGWKRLCNWGQVCLQLSPR